METLKDQANSLLIHFGQQYSESRRIPLSDLRELFGGRPYEDWKKSRENGIKYDGAVLEHIGGATRAIYSLQTTLAKARR